MDDRLPTISTFQGRLRYVRKDVLGLSRRALAEALDERGVKGASDSQIKRYETPGHEASPSMEIVRTVAEMADVPEVWLVSGDQVRAEPTFPKDAPPDGLQILGHIEAELMRQEEQGVEGGAQHAFEIVERRVQRLRGEGRIDDAGYAYWRALRRGAVLAGGYEPEDPDPEDPAVRDRAQRDIA